jgi:hypothetical protein
MALFFCFLAGILKTKESPDPDDVKKSSTVNGKRFRSIETLNYTNFKHIKEPKKTPSPNYVWFRFAYYMFCCVHNISFLCGKKPCPEFKS